MEKMHCLYCPQKANSHCITWLSLQISTSTSISITTPSSHSHLAHHPPTHTPIRPATHSPCSAFLINTNLAPHFLKRQPLCRKTSYSPQPFPIQAKSHVPADVSFEASIITCFQREGLWVPCFSLACFAQSQHKAYRASRDKNLSLKNGPLQKVASTPPCDYKFFYADF